MYIRVIQFYIVSKNYSHDWTHNTMYFLIEITLWDKLIDYMAFILAQDTPSWCDNDEYISIPIIDWS